MPTRNPLWTAVPGNVGLPFDKPGTNRLNYAMGPSKLILSCNGPPAYHVDGSTKGQASRAAARVTNCHWNIVNMGLLTWGFNTRKNFSELYSQFWHASCPRKTIGQCIATFTTVKFSTFLYNCRFSHYLFPPLSSSSSQASELKYVVYVFFKQKERVEANFNLMIRIPTPHEVYHRS